MDCCAYIADLLELDQRVPVVGGTLPEGVDTVTTPLHWRVWEAELQGHPDRVFTDYRWDCLVFLHFL